MRALLSARPRKQIELHRRSRWRDCRYPRASRMPQRSVTSMPRIYEAAAMSAFVLPETESVCECTNAGRGFGMNYARDTDEFTTICVVQGFEQLVAILRGRVIEEPRRAGLVARNQPTTLQVVRDSRTLTL